MSRKEEILKFVDDIRKGVAENTVQGAFLITIEEDGISTMCFAPGSGCAIKLLGAVEATKSQLIEQTVSDAEKQMKL